jgi:hypothetical protein
VADEESEGEHRTTPPDTAQPDDETRPHGTIRYQDPHSTTPREPTLAEQRAREQAERREEQEAAAALATAQRRTQVRRRVMIGGGVTVGVVALVSAFYTAAAYSEDRDSMIATCTGQDGSRTVAEQDQLCDESYVTSHGGHVDHNTGMYFMPIILPGGGFGGWQQYRYSYSPRGSTLFSPGQTVSNPNFTRPSSSTRVSTRSGSTIQRGGFGISSKSGSGS